jgi:hypothetical protein
MKTLLVAMLVLAGCPSTAGRGLTPFWQQRAFTMNTTQICIPDAELLFKVDLALVVLVKAAVAEGLAPSYEAASKLVDRRPGFCVIQKPEACRLGELCTIGSEGKPDCRPRAGCAGDGWAWVSLEWPEGVVRDPTADALHEVGHVVAGLLGVLQRPDHKDAWARVEERALGAYREALAAR